MYTKSDSAIQLGCFLVDFLWMRCEQDLCGSSFLEQADVDPGEIEVVEATPWTGFNSTFQFPSFLSNVMRHEKRKAFSPPQGCLLVLHCSNGKLNRQLSTFQVFRSQETAHSTITNFIELVFSPVETPMLMTFTLDN